MTVQNSATLSLSLLVNEIRTAVDATGTLDLGPSWLQNRRISFSDGATFSLKAYRNIRSGVASSQTVTYDLLGSLTDTAGGTINFDDVLVLALLNTSASSLTTPIQVGPAASNGWLGFWADASDRSKVYADNGLLLLYAGLGATVTAGTADSISVITPGTGSGYAWELLVIGRDNA